MSKSRVKKASYQETSSMPMSPIFDRNKI